MAVVVETKRKESWYFLLFLGIIPMCFPSRIVPSRYRKIEKDQQEYSIFTHPLFLQINTFYLPLQCTLFCLSQNIKFTTLPFLITFLCYFWKIDCSLERISVPKLLHSGDVLLRLRFRKIWIFPLQSRNFQGNSSKFLFFPPRVP